VGPFEEAVGYSSFVKAHPSFEEVDYSSFVQIVLCFFEFWFHLRPF
jgi:hypothetical protein